MDRIRVVVTGALGKMGQVILTTVSRQPDMEAVGGVDLNPPVECLSLPSGVLVPIGGDLAAMIERVQPQVVVDFSHASATPALARVALSHGVSLVVGTSGLAPSDLQEMKQLSQKNGVGAVVAPNFSLGAVLMMHVCKIVAPFFDYAEIIEMHNEAKADAPSGTAVATARLLAETHGKPFQYNVPRKETLAGARGANAEGVAIHSVRTPGAVGIQEVILGGLGEILTIRHDSVSRESFTPGVMLAIRSVGKRKDLVYGLDKLLGISD